MYETVVPKTELLQKSIISIDVLRESGHAFPLKYYAFPQKGTTIVLLKNTDIAISDTEIRFSKSKINQVKILFLGKYLSPLKLVYEEFVAEIALNFSETGIHYYFPKVSNKNHIFDLEELKWEYTKLFSENKNQNLENLENYLLQLYRPIAISNVENAIRIVNENPSFQTSELAKKVFLTEKTLNRQFQKYVGCTISKYKQIVKFRNTIDDYFGNRSQNLTALCHKNDYFDSPHFNKEIKKIAHFNPKDFFKNVTANGRDAYPYIFE